MATPAYAADPITLQKNHIACQSILDWEDFRSLVRANDKVAMGRFLGMKFCVVLAAGTTVYAERAIEGNECIRPQGQTECWWSWNVTWQAQQR